MFRGQLTATVVAGRRMYLTFLCGMATVSFFFKFFSAEVVKTVIVSNYEVVSPIFEPRIHEFFMMSLGDSVNKLSVWSFVSVCGRDCITSTVSCHCNKIWVL